MVNDRFNVCKSSSVFTQYPRRESSYIEDKRGLNSKIHLAVNEYGMPINFIVTDGSCANCREAIHLTKNINTKLVFVDLAYDINKLLSYLNKQNTKPIISPKNNRIYRCDYKGFKEKKQ